MTARPRLRRDRFIRAVASTPKISSDTNAWDEYEAREKRVSVELGVELWVFLGGWDDTKWNGSHVSEEED